MAYLRWCILALLVGFSSNALAQETIEPTAAQQDYNNQGVVQMQQGKLPEAVAFFRSSLSLGELNVTYLNLGRAYFRLGHCLDARESYDAVATAPKVNSPSPDEIAGLLDRFEKDYAESCSATVQITCEGDPTVSVAGAAARDCSLASSWPAEVGEQTVSFNYSGKVGSQVVIAVVGESVAVEIVPPADDPADSVVVAPAQPAEQSSMGTIGLVVGGVGIALLAGAVVYDVAVTGSAVDELESLEATNEGVARARELREEIDGHKLNTTIIGGVGLAALTTGAVLYLLAPKQAENAPSVGVEVGHDGVGVTLGGTW